MKNVKGRRKRAKEKERLLKKQLKEEELKHKKQERARKAARKEVKLLEKQSKNQRQGKVGIQAVYMMSQQISRYLMK